MNKMDESVAIARGEKINNKTIADDLIVQQTSPHGAVIQNTSIANKTLFNMVTLPRDNDLVKTINSKELHKRLCTSTEYSQWITNHVIMIFKEDSHYFRDVSIDGNYHLTLMTARALANTEINNNRSISKQVMAAIEVYMSPEEKVFIDAKNENPPNPLNSCPSDLDGHQLNEIIGDLNFVLDNEKTPIRTDVDSDNNVWFALPDVCDAIGHPAPTKLIKQLDADEYKRIQIKSSDGKLKDTNVVNESGLYTVLIRSGSDKARPFRRWVTHTVLPKIRKTGSYSITAKLKLMLPDFSTSIGQIKLLHEFISTLEENVDLKDKIISDAYAVHKYKSLIYDPDTSDETLFTLLQTAKLLSSNSGLDIGRNRLIEILRDKNFILKSDILPSRRSEMARYLVAKMVKGTGVTSYITGKGFDKIWDTLNDMFDNGERIV